MTCFGHHFFDSAGISYKENLAACSFERLSGLARPKVRKSHQNFIKSIIKYLKNGVKV